MTDEPDVGPTAGERLAIRYADDVAGWRGLAADIDEVIATAAAAERERCAKLADEEADGWEEGFCDPAYILRKVAAAIRAGEAPP